MIISWLNRQRGKHGYFHMKTVCEMNLKTPNEIKWTQNQHTTCRLKVKTEDSYLPTCTFTFSSRKPFSLPVLILIQIGIMLLVMIHIWHWIGRTFCNLHAVDVWFMPARAFPQEEVFWLISIAMSWGDFPFCELIIPHSKTEPNMFGIWLRQTVKTSEWERGEAVPVNQQQCSELGHPWVSTQDHGII